VKFMKSRCAVSVAVRPDLHESIRFMSGVEGNDLTPVVPRPVASCVSEVVSALGLEKAQAEILLSR
jgi:hypothetical protein